MENEVGLIMPEFIDDIENNLESLLWWIRAVRNMGMSKLSDIEYKLLCGIRESMLLLDVKPQVEELFKNPDRKLMNEMFYFAPEIDEKLYI